MTRTDVDINGGVVVGHDGSKVASVAVKYAADLARRLGVPLHVVRVWSITTAPRPDSMEPGYIPPYDEFEKAVLAELAAHMDAIGVVENGLEVQLHAVRGQATERLLAAAEGAEMLVVGARGGGGFKGLRFGSTANQVVRHTTVPVLVVPNNPD